MSIAKEALPVVSESKALKTRWRPPLKLEKKLGVFIGAAILVLLAALLVFSNHAESTKKAAGDNKVIRTPVLTVSCESPTVQSMERALLVHGTVSAWDPIVIGATASGLEVKSIWVDEGAFVKKGQLLASLDSAQLNAQIKSERARLAASVASVKKTIQPNRPEDINQLVATVAQAEANVADSESAQVQAIANWENAKSNADRYQVLFDQGVVSTQEAETRRTTAQVDEAMVVGAQKRVDAAKAVLRQAQEKLAMAEIGGRTEDIEIAKANVREIEGNVSRLETQIDQTFIRAPVDGLITRRDVHLGDISTAGKTMFLMARNNRLELKAQVPDTDLPLVKIGQAVKIVSALDKSRKVEGKVREISPLIDSDTRLATVRIDLPIESAMKVGMYAEGQVNVGKYDASTVPAQSVVSRDEKNAVFVLKGDQVEKRSVVIGNRDAQRIEIVSGVLPGDRVVVDGAGFLKDGDYVAVAGAQR